MKESRDLNKIELHDFFFYLKTFELEKNSRKAEEVGRTEKRARLDVESKGKRDDSEFEPKSTKPKKQKVLFSAQRRSSWAEYESADEEATIKCFMTNDVEEAFDFGSDRFSREELTEALNDMVIDYKKLSERLLDVRAENLTLKQQAETHEAEIINVGSPVSEINRLREVNSNLTETIFEKDLEIQKLTATVSAWTSSSTALKSMIEEQRPAKCRFGLGFSEAETGAETAKTDGVTKVGKTMQFVKSSHVDNHTKGLGLCYQTEPKKVTFENKEADVASWLKPKVRAARCSEPKKKPAVLKQKNVLKYNKNKTVLFGKHVRIISVWIPKGIIIFGPN